MPMIDFYAPDDLFPAETDRQLAEELTSALLRAEGVTKPSAAHLANTAAYIHRLGPRVVHTAGTRTARTVRVQVLTPPGALNPTSTFSGTRSFVLRKIGIHSVTISGTSSCHVLTGFITSIGIWSVV
jgi:hypothetical protein